MMRSRRKPLLITFVLSLAVVLAVSSWTFFAPFRDLDILIENGVLVDGSGRPPQSVNVAIRNGKILSLGKWRFLFSYAKVRINARHRFVVPGFVDVHAHVEGNIPSENPFCPGNFLRQGVTTLITGNCGRSVTNVSELFARLRRNGTFANVATLIGHNSIRELVLGRKSRNPTSDEVARMAALVDQAMMDGAVGFSTGLAYVPGRFADLNELVALANVAARHNGLYVSHIRDEGANGISSIREALEIGRRAGARLHISHFKSSGPLQWQSISQRLRLLEEARAARQEVTIDVYPYSRSSTTTDVLLPDWAIENDRAELRKASRNLELRQRLHREILRRIEQEGWRDLAHIRIASGRRDWIGQTIAELATDKTDGEPPPERQYLVDRQIQKLLDISFRGGAQAIYADMHEVDVDQVVTWPHAVFGSDSAVREPSDKYRPHPRGYGTFPRVFRLYVREKRLLTISQAVQKASAQPAAVFGLNGRGLIQPGAWADVVVLDLQKIRDRADYDHPFEEPVGVDYVIVNGVITVEHGAMTSNRPAGKCLLRSEVKVNQRQSALNDQYSQP